jgi:Na+-translocating ferredoxin:NAD+ oxidoreductase RnfG subunit
MELFSCFQRPMGVTRNRRSYVKMEEFMKKLVIIMGVFVFLCAGMLAAADGEATDQVKEKKQEQKQEQKAAKDEMKQEKKEMKQQHKQERKEMKQGMKDEKKEMKKEHKKECEEMKKQHKKEHMKGDGNCDHDKGM